ncbi:MAG: hypothetical protein D6732_01335 [Methanobacteriota archaeon]|nr:MAG: hypothetical protein D6732_01335 [Euryarchaeota archaeon]
MPNPTESFYHRAEEVKPFIEPFFKKRIFPEERPTILLVAAVAASGKTTTAQALSNRTNLPILDLAKHQPVGGNSLTGLLTEVYSDDQISHVFTALKKGNFGIIIDGLDEGLSKTKKPAFEAFLDDILKRSQNSSATTMILFGREQVIFDAWIHFEERKAKVGWIEIQPFNEEQAKEYIDNYVREKYDIDKARNRYYYELRDLLLDNLKEVFHRSELKGKGDFLSFIGYPPVLDTIAALLINEKNYFKALQNVKKWEKTFGPNFLMRISDYLLSREKDEKVFPNLVENMIASLPDKHKHQGEKAFSPEEQCARVIAHVIKKPKLLYKIFDDSKLNEKYENSLESFIKEHPFLKDDKIRNAVFEAVSVAYCMTSEIDEFEELAYEYILRNNLTYYLLYVLKEVVSRENKLIKIKFLNAFLQSSYGFFDPKGYIDIECVGASWDETHDSESSIADFEVRLWIPSKEDNETFSEVDFNFNFAVDHGEEIVIGPKLMNTYLCLPCHVVFDDRGDFEVAGLCHLNARSINIDVSNLVVKALPDVNEFVKKSEDQGLFVEAEKVVGDVSDEVLIYDSHISIAGKETALDYNLMPYLLRVDWGPSDDLLWKKYLRMRNILIHFRSHKKGGLAKFRDKIQHSRVLKDDLGQRVLDKLLAERVLTHDPKFYYLNPDQFSKKLGTTWQDLRKYVINDLVKKFLSDV